MPTLTRRPYTFRLPPAMVHATQAYAQAHLGEPLSLATLAQRVELSRLHFAHGYRQTTGEAPMAMVRRLRLARAALEAAWTTQAGSLDAIDVSARKEMRRRL